MRQLQTEVALNNRFCLYLRLYFRLGVAVVIAASLLFLVGCGGLSGGSTPSGAGAVSVANNSLSFGAVAVGSSPTLSDSISNNTSSSVTVSSITGLGSGFQVTG